MIKLTNIRLPAAEGDAGLTNIIAKTLEIPREDIKKINILKRSVDARHKSGVLYVYSVAADVHDEELALKNGAAVRYTPAEPFRFPFQSIRSDRMPVVVGMGPAGLFAALCLADAGVPCIILERGRPVAERTADVERFWKTGELDVRSNVQFGEGGAGTFSDGKLTTGVSDERISFVLKRLTEFGAPEDINYLAKPHIGTDRLRAVIASLRQELIRLGCDIRFGHQLTGLDIVQEKLTGITVSSDGGSYELETDHLILAPGNSARDTFEMLERCGVHLSAKNFSVGVRIEHLQKDINKTQYGEAATLGTLPASDYKLAAHLKNGRSVYTFCVCPGGSVIAAASEEGGVVINGMSEYARNRKNCNGGLLVSVTPDDFEGGALSGVEFQRLLERSAFEHGGGNYNAPAQLVGDFLARQPSKNAATVKPTYTPGVQFCNLWDVLPAFVCEAIAEALPQMDKSIHGFSNKDAVLTAVETRSSSPVRIDRTDYRADGVLGLYPCGEGAGYAGGIMSAAVDGIKSAEAVCKAISSAE